MESFNGALRDECLNVLWYTSLADAREQIERWGSRMRRETASQGAR